jgi:dipeptidyl aminopeptidase/acylaminoacyl peptidase
VLIVMNSDGSGQTLADEHGDDSPRWSPDGTKLTFGRTVSGGHDIHKGTLGTYNTITTDTAIVSGGYDFDPAWSPDGTKVVYDHLDTSTGGSQLYIANADGSNPQLVGDSDSGYTSQCCCP